MIDYTANCAGCGPAQLTAWVISDGVGGSPGNGVLFLSDGGAPAIALYFNGITADVVVTNSAQNPGTDYMVGVVYANRTGTCGYDIYLDVYDIQNVGSGSLTVATGFPRTYITSHGHETANPYPHIDAKPEYSWMMTGPGGYPMVNNVVVAFTDPTPFIFHNCSVTSTVNWQQGVNLIPLTLDGTVFLRNNTTSSPAFGGFTTASWGGNFMYPYNNSSYSLSSTSYVDVSVAEENSSGVKYEAFYTLTDASNSMIIGGWNFSTGLPVTISSPSGTSWDKYPRIESFKDYNYQNPLTIATYDAVNNQISPNKIYGFTNIGASTPIDYTCNIGSAPYDQYPVVAGCRGDATNAFYTVGYDHYDGTNYTYLTVPTDVAANPSLSGTFFEVEQTTPITGVASPFEALAATINNDGYYSGFINSPYVFAVWSNNGFVYKKMEPSQYYWKHAHSSSVEAINISKEWRIAPNPAQNATAIYPPLNGAHNATYEIWDITGRILQQGGISGTKKELDINKLAAGTYIVHVYENGKEAKAIKFVKG